MSVAFTAVGWNRQKLWYDATLIVLLLLGLVGYGTVIGLVHPDTTFETFVIRFTALSAVILLHFILAIGPLCRLNPLFLPLLYNRRHVGVTMFLLAFVHGAFSTIQFHAAGNANPLVSVFTAYEREYTSWLKNSGDIGQFPFEIFGFGALVIFFLMAATSHDFWLKQLGASIWKTLHTGVYVAYFLMVLHVAFGALQSERNPIYVILVGTGFCTLVVLHILAAIQRRKSGSKVNQDSMVDVLSTSELKEGCGKVVWVKGKAIALFLNKGKVFALNNVCRHQGGPLGEGKIVYDCVTCPWHGYQYRPEDGCSPPPFTEIVPTYKVQVRGDRIFVDPNELPLKTVHEGEPISAPSHNPDGSPFYIGWQKEAAPIQARFIRVVILILALFVPGLMSLIALSQNPVESGGYEFGVERTFTGVLYADPLPILHVANGSISGHETSSPNLILVGDGKAAAPLDLVNRGNGKRVEVKGSLLYWHNMVMLELNDPGSFKVLGDAPAPLPVMKLGPTTLTGELVDTKCFFGAMRPATGKIHRGCAVRCLSGGVPPGILIRDGSGNAFVVMLTSSEPDEQLEYNVEWAARVIEATGNLELYQGTLVLRADTVQLKD